MIEEWRDIKGYEGYYQVSNLGRVRSLDRAIKNKGNLGNNKISHYKGKTLSLVKNKKGYLRVILTKNCQGKGYSVHRLVAQAFIPNPNGFPEVNHIDENKINNYVNNLEWCTTKYNINYGSWREKQSISHKGKRAKKVVQIDKDGNKIQIFDSITEARNITGVKHISSVACGRRKTAGGYMWIFLNEYKGDKEDG